jgi:hypothetical protein
VQGCALGPLCAGGSRNNRDRRRPAESVPAGQPRAVGLAGLEPAASSLSAIFSSAPCGPECSQVISERQGRSYPLLVRARTGARRRCYPTARKLCERPVAGKAMGLPGGRGSPIERGDPGFGQLRRWTGRSAAMPGRRANCHQPRTVHRLRRRGGRAARTCRAWAASSCRSVMCWSASSWLSPACWLCMVLLPSCSSAPVSDSVRRWSGLLAQDGAAPHPPNPPSAQCQLSPAPHPWSLAPYWRRFVLAG